MSVDLTTTAALDQVESARLTRLERTVDRAVEVAGKIAGEALATIRDERLYRVTHHTFEAYVEERFGFSRRTAYRMIEAATTEHRQVEGLCQGGTNPQPSPRSAPGRPDSPFVIPDPVPDTDELGRFWATVADVSEGQVSLDVEAGSDFPPLGQRVLVAWER